jgi:hypothetical protein
MSASKLIDFLISLGSDPEAVRHYEWDRNAAMDAAGLSAEEKALLIRGNPNQIRAALSAASGGSDTTTPTPLNPDVRDVPSPPKPDVHPPPLPSEKDEEEEESDPGSGVHSVPVPSDQGARSWQPAP